jgi:hypothetical protein
LITSVEQIIVILASNIEGAETLILWVPGLLIGLIWGLFFSRFSEEMTFPTLRLLPAILILGVMAAMVPLVPEHWGRYLFWGQQVAMIVPLIANWQIPSIRLMAVGGALNWIAIASNGGKMPVMGSARLMAELGVKHGPFSGHWLNWLGDWISIPVFFLPEPNRVISSPGDLLIAFAIAWLTRDLLLWFRAEYNRTKKEELT